MICADTFDFLLRLTWLSGLCFAIGFILLIIEMFLPGFGVAGITGSILMLIGIILISQNFIDALLTVLIIVAILGIILFILFRSGATGKLSKTIVLKDSLGKKSGFSGSEDLSAYNSREGTATSNLRPSGTADFKGIRLNVVTQGEYIEKGSKIKVITAEGSRVVVEKIK
jgi:membrane-bound ClpP family serine protease